jgi:AcrR family transcriptional regulator
MRERDLARARLLAAAGRLFTEHGFAGTSMNEVVREANASKATLFKHFRSKEALFHAVVDDGIARMRSDEPAAGKYSGPDGDLASELAAYARFAVRYMLEPSRIVMARTALTELKHFPELSKSVTGAGASYLPQALSTRLARQQALGRLESADLQLDARLFVAMIAGTLATPTVLWGRQSPSTQRR